MLAGLLALPLGSINAVVVLYFAAFLTAYCGWTWLSIQAGLSGFAAYLPGAIAVTAPYAITDAYGRGDFAETVATSMIPLILASALSIFRADRLRAAPVAAFVFSVAILTGSHTADPALGIDLPARGGGDRSALLGRAGPRPGAAACCNSPGCHCSGSA